MQQNVIMSQDYDMPLTRTNILTLSQPEGLKMLEKAKAAKELGSTLKSCKKSDNTAACLISNCKSILNNVHIIFDTDVISCELFELQIDELTDNLDKLIEMLEALQGGLDYLFEALAAVGDMVDNIIDPIQELMDIINDLTNIEIDTDLFESILLSSETFAEFLAALLENIIDQVADVLPEEDLQQLLDLLDTILDIDVIPSDKWEDMQYFLLHGYKCKAGTDQLASCVNTIKGVKQILYFASHSIHCGLHSELPNRNNWLVHIISLHLATPNYQLYAGSQMVQGEHYPSSII